MVEKSTERAVPVRHAERDPARYEAGSSGGSFSLMRRFADERDRMFEHVGFGRNWLGPGRGAWLTPWRGGEWPWSPDVEMLQRGRSCMSWRVGFVMTLERRRR
jgi:hypothetical protein